MSQSTPSGTERIRATARGTTKPVIAQMVVAAAGLSYATEETIVKYYMQP